MSETPGTPREELKIPDSVPDEKVPSEEEVLASLEPTIEEELSPEVIEKIMEKVQDIDEQGTAYTGVRLRDFDKIMREGLLHGTKEEWIDQKTFEQYTFFNIVGRLVPLEDQIGGVEPNVPGPEIMRAVYGTGGGGFGDCVSIIFDKAPFTEVDINFYYDHRPKLKMRYYRANVELDEIKQNGWKKEEDIETDPGAGFSIRSRVAPRLFRGIVISDSKIGEGAIDKSGERRHALVEDEEALKNFQEILERVKTIILEGIVDDSVKPLPIYDTKGNLFWPK